MMIPIFNDDELNVVEKEVFTDKPQLTSSSTELLMTASGVSTKEEMKTYFDKLGELNNRFQKYIKDMDLTLTDSPTGTARIVHTFLWMKEVGDGKWVTYPNRYITNQSFLTEAIDRHLEYADGVGDGIALSALEISLGLMNGAFYSTIFVRAHDVKHLKSEKDNILLRAKEKEKGFGRVFNLDPNEQHQTGLYIGSKVRADELYTPYDLAALIYDCRGCKLAGEKKYEEGFLNFKKALAISRTKKHIRINAGITLKLMGREEEADKYCPELSELEDLKAAKGKKVTMRAYIT